MNINSFRFRFIIVIMIFRGLRVIVLAVIVHRTLARIASAIFVTVVFSIATGIVSCLVQIAWAGVRITIAVFGQVTFVMGIAANLVSILIHV